VKRTSWGEVPESPLPSENGGSVLRRFVGGEMMTVARVMFAAGSVLPVHQHANEQFSVVLEGALEFVLDGGPVVARAGDVVHLSAHEVHGARWAGVKNDACFAWWACLRCVCGYGRQFATPAEPALHQTDLHRACRPRQHD